MNLGSSRNRNICLGLLLLHLGVLVTGATGLPKELPTFFKNSLRFYGAFTSAGASYGFFSPDLGQQITIRFILADDSGSREIKLEEILPSETAIRYGNMVRFFTRSYQDEKLRRAVAASLTGQVFSRFPGASSVELIASAYVFPSLSEYARGQRPKSHEIYRANFQQRRLVHASP